MAKNDPKRPKKDDDAVIVNRLLGELHRSEAEPQIISDTPVKRPPPPRRRRLSSRLMPSSRPERPGLSTWSRVVLGLILAIGMTQWPYTHDCGIRLFFYATGVVTLLAAGMWSGVFSWYHRLVVAHLVSLALVLAGLVLAAGVVLPRVGYASAAATWRCSAAVTPASPVLEETTPPAQQGTVDGTVPVAPVDSNAIQGPGDSVPQ